MTEILLRPPAEADIENIADYTLSRWGRERAASYIAALEADISSLVRFAERFPLHEPTGLGLRRMSSGHHLVFYLITTEAIEIVRVLHERQDPTREAF